MLKKRIFLIVVLSIFAFISVLYFYQKKSIKDEQNSTYQLQAHEIEKIREGDIILRHGYGIISDMIVKVGKEPYPISHCGVVCKDEKQNWIVIHTVSNTLTAIDGMQSDPLAVFVKNSKENSIIVVRYKNTNDSCTKLFTQQAFYYLNKKVPFDDRFDSNDSSELYCTEFIRQLYLDVYHTDIYSQYSTDMLRFSPFLNEKLFDIIVLDEKKKD
ncbi:MAG TPA: YiiX/YebB-like N1pC/P60 family cysteine hydrolase [Bacteroidales bacterium]|nr:YiiX/YebB-like N1pC/P60 family cysteine hydrolase [Bacteroidales bacterium]HOR81062.1 YiiX/YebB-like N1pC/P60 family cysteine hydrolase [Bacteroidales bacterium]HPJ91117.1 YiiX/YebB-like N1pC/P60 family cysteine hydrolase [Bacteroidales bacterium]